MLAVVVVWRGCQVNVSAQGNLRTQISIGFIVAVLSINPIQKWKVVIAMTSSAIMSHEWIILVAKIPAVYPRVVVIIVELVIVVVAKIVLAAIIAEKEVNEKVCTDVNAVVRAVSIRVMNVSVVSKGDGGEDSASFFKFIIPVPSTVNAASRCPDITRRNPNPIFFTRVPVPRSPEILLLIPLKFPMARAVKIVFVGSFGRRSTFKITRWLG